MKENLKSTGLKRLMAAAFALLLCVPFALAQSQVRVTGKVIDNLGEPMIGVSILEKGTSNGVVSDIDGNYSLNATEGGTLVFSYVGYVTQEHKATAGTLNITMKEDSETLDELVVVGYGVQKKSSVTGAISQVKPEDMANRPVQNVQQALQGKTAGVQIVNTSAAPGSAPAIRIRGYSSNSDMSPLYVVDGVRLSNISGIDPNDIASIEVLKDAASAAIYGAQAGNGVVLVTTKRGKAGENRQGTVVYDFQMTAQSLSHMPELMNAEEYLQFNMEGGRIHSLEEAYQLGWDGVTDTDWSDVAFETSWMQKHSLSVANAGEKGSYYLSLSYLDNNGIVKGDNDTYQRLTGAINAEYEIKPWLKVGTNNQLEYYEAKSVPMGTNGYGGNVMASVLQMDPLTASTYSPDNLPTHMQNLLAQGQTLLTDENGNYYGISNFYNAEGVHPLILRDRNSGKTTGYNVNGSVYGELKPFKDLVITSRFGYRLSSSHNSNYRHKYYASSSTGNKYIGISATTSNSIYYQWENFANYHHTFADVHDVTGMIGMSFAKTTSNGTTGSFSGNDTVGDAVQVDDVYGFGDLNYGKADATKGVSGGTTVNAQLSYFGRVGYTYDDKYMAQFSLRADAYDLSKLPATNRWGYFPAFSLGWDVTRESFMESTRNWLSSLKLRYSWGKNGSIAALSGYKYSTDIARNGMYPFLPTSPYDYSYGYSPATMGNDELEWETSTQNNVGVDARFLNDRLTFSVDWYKKETKGLLVTGITPSLIAGGTASPMNAGNVMNKGFEFELGWRDNIKDFSYGIRANLSTLDNEVTYLHPSITRLSGFAFSNNTVSVFEKGYPVWHFYGYKFSHIDENGNAVMQDLNNDGAINDEDKTDIGDAIPSLTYGITLNAAYKGFDLTVFGSGTAGNDIFMGLTLHDKLSANRIKEVFYDGRWIEGADNSHATKPSAAASMDQYLFSDAMVFNGSYFKIKQIQLGYTFPKQLLKKAYISNLRIYCSLDDFFTFTSYPGMDPEISAGTGGAQGFDTGVYPTSKKVVFGLNITF